VSTWKLSLVVDEGRVARLLRGLTDRVARLREAGATPVADRGRLWLDGVKYVLITAVEACVDVAQHIGSSEGFPAPDSNADAIRVLGERGVLDPELAASLARAVGFRNVLVHQYTTVDDAIVLAALDRLDEFDAFVAQVSSWVLGR
jgi:uncharacterized protein YutE (UPF0331/DUF86 family)